MKHRKILLLTVALSGALVYLAGCSKESEDHLQGQTNCDTTNISYSLQVVPILRSNCYPCHGAGNTAGSGGNELATFGEQKVYADNGFLVGNVTHAPGYIGMPYGLPKLPACEMNTIVAWVHQGTKNN
jgi:hypothetical protein